MKIVKNILVTGSFVFFAGTLLPGCLILADPPKVEAGEHCAVNKNCPQGMECKVAPGGSEKLCLPIVPECTIETDPACAGFKCKVQYQYCDRDCVSAFDCVGGYDCNYDYSSHTGVCVVASTP